MKLLKVFNQNFLHVMRIMNKSFNDVPELTAELKVAEEAITENAACTKIHDEFKENVDQKVMDRIFKKDEDVIKNYEIGFLKRSNMPEVYERMYEAEQEVLWKNLQALCRYSSMLRACGEQLCDMEDMALDFMQDNKTCAPEDYHMKLFQEMLSGGKMSQKLMETFKDPSCIKNILSNVGNIMKSGEGEGDGDLSDFASLLSMPFSDEDMEEVTKGVQDTLAKKIEENEDENSYEERVVEVEEE